MDILSALNPKQQQAVTAVEGPVLVIAGPGSGKTACLTRRIAYLVQQGISPENILAVTFTNKAAEEMRHRVRKLLPPSLTKKPLPTIGTFHSVCLQVLRRNIDKFPAGSEQAGYQKNFVVYDRTDQLALIKKNIEELEINPEQFRAGLVQNLISRAKDELIDARKYEEQASEYFPQNIARIYSAYQASLKKAQALDFDDLILFAVQLFQQKRKFLENYQNQWRYILVDEAHDNNSAQYQLTNLLAQKTKNLWCIADVDQSIYGWRGADFRNILNFEKDYSQAQVIFLEQNYRSTQNILQAAHHIISKNRQRKEKNLWTENDQGNPVYLVQAPDEEQEGNFLTEEIENLIRDEGLALKDFTVLYRTNAQSRSIEEAFLKAGLPYKIIGAVRFYERREIKDILAYLRIVHNPYDLTSLTRIINVPPRRLAKYGKVSGLSDLEESSLADSRLKNFLNFLKSLRRTSQTIPLTKLIKEIIDKVDYKKYLQNRTDQQEEMEKRWENVRELFSVAAKYDQEKSGLEKFLTETTLLSSSDEVATNKDLINLMTLHCAKGLEFPVVFIVGLEEGILPHSKSILEPGQMEEERRLCYVGITRAKQRLYLTFTRQRKLWGQTLANMPSRFLGDIPEELVEFRQYF